MITSIIINYLPAFVLGFVFIFCTFKYIGTFKGMCNDIKQYSTYKKLEDHMKALLNENYDLKKDNKELKEQIAQLSKDIKEIAEEYNLEFKHIDNDKEE